MVPMPDIASALTPEQWENLDDTVRRVDEDRWLSSRYAATAQRRRLIALYAFYYELAKVRLVTTEPGLAAIRFQWWRDALEEISGSVDVRRHDVAMALKETLHRGDLLLGLVDGHASAVESGDRRDEPEPLLMRIAASCLGDSAWAGFETVAIHFAGGRRGVTGCPGEDVARVPRIIRPAVAHGRLRHVYAKGCDPNPLSKRLSILNAMISGKV